MRQTEKSLWRFYPWAVAAFLGVVIAVNGGMIYAALSTFPGKAGSDGFDLSNHYNTVIEHVQQQAALGWKAVVGSDKARHPIITLSDKSGTALAAAGIDAVAERPVGDPRTTPVRFTEVAPGQYVSAVALDEPGQWDLMLSVNAGGHNFTTTRRIVVP